MLQCTFLIHSTVFKKNIHAEQQKYGKFSLKTQLY